MAIANIKDLWELAATMMGANYASEIIDSNTDMSSPTTPVELTTATAGLEELQLALPVT